MNLVGLRPYLVTKLHEEILQKEVDCLFPLGALERANKSEWKATSLTQRKPKTN